ncbi:hypothetical protein LOTGIDRAFT_161256 [Lottia gigantea]|uniref:Pacifastin domain-containing protein n=1 Tax=Lottia gigantea TaxID=225164 RepID=V4AH96_LOTGI|nr:hypothetical protein LOTGIDRAFT_161256 [Lottia gigantea]ESO94555.1 hypothetical protein LOTGIDRAFT_161256 [Lottia gigantea]
MKILMIMVVLLVCLYGAYSIPIQGVCNYNGQQHKVGDTFKSSDNCNTCGCGGMGMIFCTQRACIKTCSYNGQSYFPGLTFKSADGCNDCDCQNNGAVVCTERACATLV